MIKAISKGYQVTIPAEWRNEMGLTIGSKIDIEKEDNKITIRPLGETSFADLFKKADKTKKHKLTPKQIKAMDSDIYG